MSIEASSTISPDDVKHVPFDDGVDKQISSTIKYLRRLLHILGHKVHKEPNLYRRRNLLCEINMLSPSLRRLSFLSKGFQDQKPTCQHDKEHKTTSVNFSDVEATALVKHRPDDGIDRAETDGLLKHNKDSRSEFSWARKLKKPERYLGIAKERKLIKEMRGLYFPLSKGLIYSHGLKSKRPRSSKMRQRFKWRCLLKRQHSKDSNPTWEDGSEDSHYAEGTGLHKPAPPDSVVPPKRRRSPSLQDSYTSLEDDNAEGISKDSSDAEGKPMPEVQNTSSEDGSDVEDGDFSDVEDPDAKDDEYSTNVEDVEDSTSVGELEDSSDGEYSSDGTTLLKLSCLQLCLELFYFGCDFQFHY